MLKSLLKSASIITIAAVSCLSVSADETPSVKTNFPNIYYFGDSLTDGRPRVSLPPLNTDGIYLNGNTWAKHLSNNNNIPYNPAQNNFARSAANTMSTATIPGLLSPNTTQIDNFNATASQIGDKDLIAIWIGHNDLTRTPAPGDSAALIARAQEAAGNVIISMQTLITQGVKNFIVFNLADFSQTPLYKPLGQTVQNSLMLFTDSFQLQLDNISTNINVIALDLTRLEMEIVSNPSQFLAGATSTADFFLSAAEDVAGMNVHPNLTAQSIIGNWVSDLLAAPLPFIAIPDYTIGMMDKSNQVIFARQTFLKHHCYEKAGLRFYAEGDMGENTLTKKATPYAAKSSTTNIAVGVEAQAESRSTLGFKITHDSNNLKFNTAQTLKKVDLSETILSLYGFMFVGDHLNLAANASYGGINVDTKRMQKIGIHNRSEPGTGTGQHFSLATQIGYDFDLMENIILTPYVSAAYHHVKLDDIKEKNMTSTSLVYRLPKETAQFYRVGVEALGQFEFHDMQVKPFVNLAAVKETRSRSNKVQARSTSFQRFFTLESAKVMKDDTYMDAQAGVNFGFTCKDTISAKYGGKFFSSKQKSHYASLSYSRAL